MRKCQYFLGYSEKRGKVRLSEGIGRSFPLCLFEIPKLLTMRIAILFESFMAGETVMFSSLSLFTVSSLTTP